MQVCTGNGVFVVAPVIQRAQRPRNRLEAGLLAQKLRHLASRIDAFFQLAIQLQHKVVAVIDDGEALIGLLRSRLQVGLDRMSRPCGIRACVRRPVRPTSPRMRLRRTMARSSESLKSRSKVAAVEQRRASPVRGLQPRQHRIGTVAQDRLSLVAGRPPKWVPGRPPDRRRHTRHSGTADALRCPAAHSTFCSDEPGNVAALAQEPRALAQHARE